MRSTREQLQFELSLPQFYSVLRTLEQVRLPARRAAGGSVGRPRERSRFLLRRRRTMRAPTHGFACLTQLRAQPRVSLAGAAAAWRQPSGRRRQRAVTQQKHGNQTSSAIASPACVACQRAAREFTSAPIGPRPSMK